MLAHPSALQFLPAAHQIPTANHYTSAPSLTTNCPGIGPNNLRPELRVHPSTAGPSPYIHPDVHQPRQTHQNTITPFFDKALTLLPNPVPVNITELQINNLLQSIPQSISRLSNMEPSSFTPHTGSFSSSQGAFQPTTSGIRDMVIGPGTDTHVQLQRDPEKPGRWCAMHGRIAWHVHHYRQELKTGHINANALPISRKPDVVTVSDLMDATQNPRNISPDTCFTLKIESPITQVKYRDLETLNIKDLGGLIKTTQESSHVEPTEPQQSTTAKEPGDKDKPERAARLNVGDGTRHPNTHREAMKRDMKKNLLIAPFYDSPSTNVHFQHAETSEPSHGSYSCKFGGRKREHECEVNVKSAKQDRENGFCEMIPPTQCPKRPCPVNSRILNPFSLPMSVQQMATESPMQPLYPINSANDVAKAYNSTQRALMANPGAEKYRFETPSWGQLGEPVFDKNNVCLEYGSMDISAQQELLMRGYSLNDRDAAQILEAQRWYRDAEAYQTFLTPAHVQPPPALGHQARCCLREHELRHSFGDNYYHHYCSPQLPFHPTSVGPHPYQARFLPPNYHIGPTSNLGFPKHSGSLRKTHTSAASLISTTNIVSH